MLKMNCRLINRLVKFLKFKSEEDSLSQSAHCSPLHSRLVYQMSKLSGTALSKLFSQCEVKAIC
jgi:hypothetical protein